MSNRKDNEDFLSKFGDRIEMVGRDGVMGIMKTTGNPINSGYTRNINNNNQINQNLISNNLHKTNFDEEILRSPVSSCYSSPKQKNYAKKTFINNSVNIIRTRTSQEIPRVYASNDYFKNDNEKNNNHIIKVTENDQNHNLYRYNKYDSSKMINYFLPKKPKYSSENNFNNNYEQCNLFNKNNNNIINQSQKNLNNNRYNNDIYNNLVANNRQNIVDHGYTPYTLKDYKKITNDVKLGKLGPNIGTKEWKTKRDKMQKMSEYGNKIMSEGKGCYVKLTESADDRHKRLQEMKMHNGKWNIINEYSRGIMENNIHDSNVQFKRNVNEKLLEEEMMINNALELERKQEEEEQRILQDRKNNIYQQRLNKMKNMLFN